MKQNQIKSITEEKKDFDIFVKYNGIDSFVYHPVNSNERYIQRVVHEKLVKIYLAIDTYINNDLQGTKTISLHYVRNKIEEFKQYIKLLKKYKGVFQHEN